MITTNYYYYHHHHHHHLLYEGIYTYIPETNCVTREYSIAAILLLQFMVLKRFVTKVMRMILKTIFIEHTCNYSLFPSK